MSTNANRILARLVLFGAAFAFWLLISWPVSQVDGHLLWGDIGAGVLAAALVALVMRDLVTSGFARLVDPLRYIWAALYLPVLAWYIFKANLDVAYRVLHPAMPIRPGIVRVHSRLRTASARTALATSITLTPGTLTVDVTSDGVFYVHWIEVSTLDEQEAAKRIVGRFEWFIAKILE
jgi:multicomponent Na+:H+ antiporter subunit E